MRICFTDFFLFFLFFSVRHKSTRQPFSGTAEQIYIKLLPNESGENVVSNVAPKWGLGPLLIFWGLKTTHCALGGDAWRMTQKNYFMLVCWLWHCAATAVELQMHEGVNAFNLVILKDKHFDVKATNCSENYAEKKEASHRYVRSFPVNAGI